MRYQRTMTSILSFACFLALAIQVKDVYADQGEQARQVPVASNRFDRKVAPILAANCLTCHSGPKPKGKLDLSTSKTAMKADLINPGKLGESLLWDKIESDEMPPKHPLSDADKAVIKKWIEDGGKWGTDPIDPFAFSSDKRAGKDWWSLQPLKRQAIPEVAGDAWSLNAIDRFVLARLKQAGLKPSPQADPRTLIRRLYVDMVGLPPPPQVVQAFEKDPSPQSWEKLVDELLASEHYGERWARHWLDVARFGESSGFEYNAPRESAWHYRDWVIRALNSDMPYDQFVRMQLAGDLINPDTVDGAAAVGFLVAGVHNTVLGNSPRMKMAGRQDELEEIAGTVGQAFLGMTIHCARCHDHKFDPISAKEYYQFIAALDGIRHGERRLAGPRPTVNDNQDLRTKRADLHRQLADLVVARGGRLSGTANIVTSKRAFDANQKGVTYRLSLKLAPTVWAGASQATAAGDGVIVRLIGADNRVVASRFLEAEPWGGGRNALAYRSKSFNYVGDGTGHLRIQVQPYPLHAGRFGGAIDDLVLSRGDDVIFNEDFDRLQQTQPAGTQADTERRVFHSAASEVWLHTGINTLHAEQRAEGNLALQLFGGNGSGTVPQPDTDAERKLQSRIVELERKINAVMAQSGMNVYTVVPQRPGVMRVHERGSVEILGDVVAPGGLKAVKGLAPVFDIDPAAPDAPRRLKLADWITARGNPLFHRVAVNRIWHYHFGQGIVNTPNDFGFSGGRPSHPQLLDWLALWFRDQGYSLKKLHKLIVTSATYQQASSVTANPTHTIATRIDMGNRLLWRQNARRVEAEVLRDSILTVSGALNTKMYGPGFKDVRIEQVPPAYFYVAIDPIGEPFNRRAIYRWMPRGQRSALLDTFNCPDPSVTAPVRSVTTTPSQVLSQWNHPFVLRMSERLAARVAREAGPHRAKQVEHLWRLVLARRPDRSEAQGSQSLVERHGLGLLARVLFNSNEFIWIE